MEKDALYRLLDEMASPDCIINLLDIPRWKFWKKSERLEEDQLFPLLREFIELRSKKQYVKIRENAYAVLAKLLHRNMKPDYCQFLIDSLERETNKYVLDTILDGIGHLRLPSNSNIAAIITCSKSDEWLVRHSAIMALGVINTDASREAVRYWVGQKDDKLHKYELIDANAALGYIGEPSDIDLLEQHIHSRIPDVKDSAIYAINNIKQRFERNAAP